MVITIWTSKIVHCTSVNGQQIANAQTSLPACWNMFEWALTRHVPPLCQDLHASDALLFLDHLLPFSSVASYLHCCFVWQDKETFTATVLDVNQGGLICRCQSLQAFIPISQLNRERDTWLSPEVSCSAVLCCAAL